MKNNLNPIFELIRADGSIIINKALCFAIGLEETIVFSELLTRYNYFNTRDELDEDGFFFNTIDDFERGTTLDDKHQKKAITKLEKLGLIQTDLKGLPARRYFKIIDDPQLVLKYIQFGKDKIEVLEEKQRLEREKSLQRRKKRLEGRQTKANQLFRQNGETCSVEEAKQDVPFWRGNNTNINNTNLNNYIDGSSQDEVREGTKGTPTNSIPYYDYIAQLLKKCNTSFKAEILESIIYYYSKYKETLNVEHIRYKEKNCIEIISRLDTFYAIGIHDEKLGIVLTGMSVDTFKIMTNKHFETKYKKMQYTLMSFMNDNVLKNRYYETKES